MCLTTKHTGMAVLPNDINHYPVVTLPCALRRPKRSNSCYLTYHSKGSSGPRVHRAMGHPPLSRHGKQDPCTSPHDVQMPRQHRSCLWYLTKGATQQTTTYYYNSSSTHSLVVPRKHTTHTHTKSLHFPNNNIHQPTTQHVRLRHRRPGLQEAYC